MFTGSSTGVAEPSLPRVKRRRGAHSRKISRSIFVRAWSQFNFMLKKTIVGILIINGLAGLVLAQVSPAGSTSQKDFIKNEVIRIGENRRIKQLVLNDGTKLKGFIKEIRSDSFVLVNGYRIANSKVIAVDRSNSAREIRFDQVSKIKPYRN